MGHCSSKQSLPSASSHGVIASLPNSDTRRLRGHSSKQVVRKTSKRIAAADGEVSKRVIGCTAHHKHLRLVTSHDDESRSSSHTGRTQASTFTDPATFERVRSIPRQNIASSPAQSFPLPLPRDRSSCLHQKQHSSLSQNNKGPPSFKDMYRILPGRKLGVGIAGQVHQCIHRQTSQVFAVKIMAKSRIRRQDRIRQEIALMRQVRHPNIVMFYDVFDDANDVHIVTEMCNGGELFDKIVEKANESMGRIANNGDDESRVHPACFRERDAARIIHSLLSAVSYLHSIDVVHRDIKPENVLFERDDDESPIKLIDFGLSIRHTKRCAPLSSVVGTAYYMSPELLDGKYDRACDLWSVGVVAYVLLSGRPPFNGSTDDAIFEKIRSGKYNMSSRFWRGVSEYAKDFIRCLLDVSPERRLTADMALNHAWLKLARLEC